MENKVLHWNKNDFREWCNEGCDMCVVQKVIRLDLNETKLKNVPTIISKFTNLIELNLSGNNLTTIPDFIGYLPQLKFLYLRNNKLTSLPDSIGNLKLHLLDLQSNQLSNVPECISRLCELNNLSLSMNQLTHIPESTFYFMPHLQILFICENQLNYLPNSISYLTELKYLYLNTNNLSSIPESVCDITNLYLIFIRNNKFTTIPTYFCRILQRTSLYYDNNPIEYIPPQVQRMLDRQKPNFRDKQKNIYNDTQSVHLSSIQKSFRETVEKITNQKGISQEELYCTISENEVLTDSVKQQLFEYMGDPEPHSVLHVNFMEMSQCVFGHILKFPKDIQEEIFKVMNVEMSDAICKCFTGRLTRLVNCLNGFDPDVVINISTNEQMSNIILMIREKLEDRNEYTTEKHCEEVEKEFRERGIDEDTITEWIGYL